MKLFDGGASAAAVALLYTIFLALIGAEYDNNMDEKNKEIADLEEHIPKIVVQDLGHGPKVRPEPRTFYIPQGVKNLEAVLSQFKEGDVIYITAPAKPSKKLVIKKPKPSPSPDSIKTKQSAPVIIEDPKPAEDPEKPAEAPLKGKELDKILEQIKKAHPPKEPIGVDRR